MRIYHYLLNQSISRQLLWLENKSSLSAELSFISIASFLPFVFPGATSGLTGRRPTAGSFPQQVCVLFPIVRVCACVRACMQGSMYVSAHSHRYYLLTCFSRATEEAFVY